MVREDFLITSPTECHPLGRRIQALSYNVECIKWPTDVAKDLQDAELILEILVEDAKRDCG